MKAAAPPSTFGTGFTRIACREGNRVPEVRSLPPAGPAWFSSVMGTGILALLVELHLGRTPIGGLAAIALLMLAWALLLGLGGAFMARCHRNRRALQASCAGPAGAAAWGTVSMGILSVGSATLKVAAAQGGSLAAVGQCVDAVLWTVGTAIGFATAVGFTVVLLRFDRGRPAMTWGLPVVPPMVTATAGATLAPLLPVPWHALVWWVAVVGFLIAGILAAVIFAVAYHHHLRVAPIPIEASATSWIPLGVVGQSTAAAVALASESPLAEGRAVSIAHGYGYAMLLVGVPVIWFAARTTIRGFRARMPFAPTWWSLTFPIGTLSLGAHLLGTQTGQAWIVALGWVALAVLVGTWALCASATIRAVTRARVAPATTGAAPGNSAPATVSTGPARPAQLHHRRPPA